MEKKWYQWFFTLVSFRESNFLEVTGAFITMLSVVTPWFYIIYWKSSATVSGAEQIIHSFSGLTGLPLYCSILALYALALPALVLFLNRPKISAILSVAGLGGISAMLAFLSLPLDRLGWGIFLLYGGMILMSLSFLRKEG